MHKQRRTDAPRPLSPPQLELLRQATTAQSRGDLGFAESAYRRLIAEKAGSPPIFCNLAAIYDEWERYDEAHRLWTSALKAEPDSLQASLGLAGHFDRLGQVDKAKKLYQRIVDRHPGHVPARYLLANQYKAQGDFAEATERYRQILNEQPGYTPAHFNYAAAHRYRSEDDPHIRTMQGLLEDGGLAVENRIHLAFALAKAYEDLKAWDRAFEYLERGNSLRRSTFPYSIESDAQLIENIIRTFNARDLSRVRADSVGSNRPIFIVGMVRSGTSLVEKILSSHSDVYGAGELQYIFSLAGSLFLRPSLRYQFGPLDSYPASAFGQFGQAYLDRVGRLDSQSPRVTDKMPFNMMMLGLIRLALPGAKIIHCVRDARDTCLSIYRQNFATGNYRFAYDLQTIGQFYRLYLRLMEHWHQVFPGAIYDVSYEALTQNPESEIRNLLAACDLEWQDQCLTFHSTPGVVRTASFYQVRQPIYRSSVKLWQRYEKYLQPLFDALEGA